MIADYVYWQYIWVPSWLASITVTTQKGLLQYFSVPLMLKTLFSHWHRDVVPYRGGTISRIVTTFAWNQISRAVGFVIRCCVLLLWLVFEIVFLSLTVLVWVGFLLWPVFVILSLVLGIGLVFV